MELMIPGAVQKNKSLDAVQKPPEKTGVKPTNLTPVPTPTPSIKPTVVDSNTGLKSRYAVKYTGLSRGFAW
jgi:hypothetical protein